MPQLPGDAPILATKLFVPPPRENLVARTRLRDRLSAGRGGRVTLIAAAAGWGKSTLLADWALETPGRVAWLSIDKADDEPRRFLNYVIAALRTSQAIGANDLFEALSAKPEAVRDAATELLNAISAQGEPVSLVLDDYHTIDAREVHDVVQFIVDHLPPNLHLILATRADPPLGLSRLRARGMLLELRGNDLRFTADETQAFLNGAMGLALDSAEIRELSERTEGWVVGLQMAAISLNGRGESRAFIDRFSGSNRYVLDYLTDEVLDRQPEHVRQFLLNTSILTRMSPDLCDAVMQRTDSEAILQQLDASNLFLIPLDDVRYWYRYHHLFASLLQHQLSRTRTENEIAELHRRASEWFAANRMPESALEHALAAKDIDRAVAIVGANALARTLSGDTASAVHWFNLLPQERIDRDINLLLPRAMSYLGDWQLGKGYETVMKADALLTDDSPSGQRGAVLGLRGGLERLLGELEKGNENLARARALLTDDTFWFSFVALQSGVTAMMEADTAGTLKALEVVRAYHARPHQVLPALLGQTYTAMAELFRGDADRAFLLGEEMFGWVDITEKIAGDRRLDCLPNAVLSEVHHAWNDLAKAREFGDRAVELGRRAVMPGFFQSVRSLTLVARAQQDWETANRAAHDMRRALRNVGSQFFWIPSVEALAYSVLFRRWQAAGNRSDLDTVERWLRESNFVEKLKPWPTRRLGGFDCDASLLLAVRVMIEKEKYSDATALLDEIWPHAVSTDRLMPQIEVLILRSLIAMRTRKTDESIEAMQKALQWAGPSRYLRLFLDEGAAIAPIIERAAIQMSNRDFPTRVLSSLAVPLKPAIASEAPEGLSVREIEVLRLVASGASNQDAARKLFIAPTTVKKHLENIYSKLRVGGRTEAIARAHELKLLQ